LAFGKNAFTFFVNSLDRVGLKFDISMSKSFKNALLLFFQATYICI
jgi:hypothetical protein